MKRGISNKGFERLAQFFNPKIEDTRQPPEPGEVPDEERELSEYEDQFVIEVVDDLNDKVNIHEVALDRAKALSKFHQYVGRYEGKEQFVVQLMDDHSGEILMDNQGMDGTVRDFVGFDNGKTPVSARRI